MAVLLTIKLKEITYSGDNIGDDLSFQFNVKDHMTHVRSRISCGQRKSFNRVLFQENVSQESLRIPISVDITEADTVFDDTGSGSSEFNVQTGQSGIQTHSFHVNVFASGGDKGKKATFTFMLEAIVENLLKVDIIEPLPDQNHTCQVQPNYNSTGPITFKAKVEGINYTGNIDWNLKLEYETDGGGVFESIEQFTTTDDQAVDKTFTSKGGRLIIEASAVVNGAACSTKITNFITGVGIPNAAITQRLRYLYTPLAGGTDGLLTGVAMKESSYRQFFNRYSKYGFTARWPVENIQTPPPRGSYIGMMQVPVAMNTAWDWLANTQRGADVFAEKLAIASNQVANLQSTHQGLRDLSGVELENYALSLYGGFRIKYYTPVQTEGRWDWQMTTREKLLVYVSFIRANIQP